MKKSFTKKSAITGIFQNCFPVLTLFLLPLVFSMSGCGLTYNSARGQEDKKGIIINDNTSVQSLSDAPFTFDQMKESTQNFFEKSMNLLEPETPDYIFFEKCIDMLNGVTQDSLPMVVVANAYSGKDLNYFYINWFAMDNHIHGIVLSCQMPDGNIKETKYLFSSGSIANNFLIMYMRYLTRQGLVVFPNQESNPFSEQN